ncbi:MAG TPA: hypothetical protein VKW78_23205 [Terriglobales bacterium]|nr:hypothetical protein [Terriglobales bacterium]
MKWSSFVSSSLIFASCAIIGNAQSVADTAKSAQNGVTTAKVFDQDSLDAIHARAHVSSESLSNEKFCDNTCQDEVRGMLLQKASPETAASLLTDGLTSARQDGSWQELIGRVQTAVCTEKKTGSPASGDAALQREVLLKITQEQKDMAELQDQALRTSAPSTVNALKLQAVKLMVIGVGLKHIASGSGCTN